MMIRAYLEWSRTAGAAERAEAAGMLAEVYLRAELSQEDRRDAEAALVLAVDDPSPLVRRALAEALGGDERAPRAVVAALARDQAEIAALVIANSPVLTDAEVADIAVAASGIVLQAACARPYVSPDLAAALAVSADAAAAVALLDNPGAEVSLDVLRELAARHGEAPAFREALLEREDLPAEFRFALADAAARQLTAYCAAAGWLPEGRAERLRRDAAESAVLVVAVDAGDSALATLAQRLRREGRMTPQLLLRALLCGEVRFFAAALADLAEIEPRRALGFVHGRSAVGFAALCRKAGLPRTMDPAFAAAISAHHALGGQETSSDGKLSRFMIETVLSAVALLVGPDIDRLRALLMGYLAEAMREEARVRIAGILAESAGAPSFDGGAAPSLPAPERVGDGAADGLDQVLVDALAQELVDFRAAA